MTDDLFDDSSSEDAWEARIRRHETSKDKLSVEKIVPSKKIITDPSQDTRPLAERMRPQTFDEYVGQLDLMTDGAPLRELIRAGTLPSLILWGPPGSGKTTLARLISQEVKSDFFVLSGVTASLRDIRSVADAATANRKFARRTVLFIDEIHRFNKAQQDAFLPHVESGIITMIGATTENPSFSVISPLLSRCRVFTLKALDSDALTKLIQRGLDRMNSDFGSSIQFGEGTIEAIISLCDGDARRALGIVEVVVNFQRNKKPNDPVLPSDVAALVQRHLIYDKQGEEHFNLISALHKTMRSSDPHGAMYWVGRMMAAGEDPLYILRRMVRFASEDVGLADPFALNHAMECLRAYQLLGSPEGDLTLMQCAAYLAMAPKSNAIYRGHSNVVAAINKTGSLPVPMHLRNAPTKLMKDVGYGEGYSYDHDEEGGFAAKQGLPNELHKTHFYEPSSNGREKDIKDRLARLDEERDKLK